MKRNNLARALAVIAVVSSMLSGCQQEKKVLLPEIDKIRQVAHLSTSDIYIHNVATAEKKAGGGIFNIGKANRQYWVVYSGHVILGVDISKIQIEVDEDRVMVKLPPAKILGSHLDTDSFQQDNIYKNKDNWWNQNPITKTDQQKAVDDSFEESVLQFWENTILFDQAQERAKDLIETYIKSIGSAAQIDYKINWELEPYEIPEAQKQELEEMRLKREEQKKK